uniref:ZP domain-containing protein n=1 Tax=Macrostomum lignano TaxID=282301 RepID=A0A1I8G791_9PLAT
LDPDATTAPPRRVESFVAASTASAEVTGAPSKVGPRSNSSSGSRRSPLRLGRSDGLTLTCRTSCGAAVSAASRRPPVRVGFQRLDRIGLPPSGLSFDVEALQSPDLLLESVSDTRVGHCDAGCRASSANDSVSWITWTEVTVRMDNCSQLALDGRTRFYSSAGSVLGLALVALGFVIFCRSCDCGGGSKSQEESGASTVNV